MPHHSPSQRILVTGSAGAIGRMIAPALRRAGHFVRGFDRVPESVTSECRVGELTDPEAVGRAVEGCDAVIHLAAYPNAADFLGVLLEPNVVGLCRVIEAVERAGVPRLVLASTLQVVSGHDSRQRLVRLSDGPMPLNHYASTKLLAEAMGQVTALRRGSVTRVVAARIGWFLRNTTERDHMMSQQPSSSRSTDSRQRYHPWYLSHRDAQRFFRAAVEHPMSQSEPFALVFAVGRQPEGYGFDLEPGRRRLGYEPTDEAVEGSAFDDTGRAVDAGWHDGP